jgi:hypothetical protein
MCSRGVLVHRLSCLGAAVPVMAAEIPCRDGVFTKGALERAKAGHHRDGVISHNCKCSRIILCNSELKSPSPTLPAMNCDVRAAGRHCFMLVGDWRVRTIGPSL